MESLPVTLIVKAPNQQIEDQKITCETSWTINKLKQHLSEVYPSKPPHHEQKLIYSGQLLNDSLVLKDILRQYEGQDTHTVHLVCTPKHIKMNTKPKPSTPVAETNSGGSRQANSNTSSTGSGNVSAETSTQTSQRSQSTNASESRVPPTFPNSGFQWTMPNGQFQPADYSNLNQYQMQMAWMQQAYMQYMSQYMQLAAGQTPITTQPTIPTPSNTPPTTTAPQNNNQPQDAGARGAAQGAPPNPIPAANPNPVENNEERDWLDIFYTLSRALVLFSVVYFYSSPVRFVFVLFLVIALYLYQTGFFRNIHLNNNNINVTPDGVGVEEEQAPTRLTVAWTFITTFFASLIPEVPNINA